MGQNAAGDTSSDALPATVSVLQEFFAGSAVESLEQVVGPGKGASVRVRAGGKDWVLKRHPPSGSARPGGVRSGRRALRERAWWC